MTSVCALFTCIACLAPVHGNDGLSLGGESDELMRLKARVSQLEEQVRQLRWELEQHRQPFSSIQGSTEAFSLRVIPQPVVPFQEPLSFFPPRPPQPPLEFHFQVTPSILNLDFPPTQQQAQRMLLIQRPTGDLIDDRPRQRGPNVRDHE
jgi:hypothetical protein